MKTFASIVVIIGALTSVNVAHADGPDPTALKGMYDMSRASYGLVSFCVDKGFLKSDSIG